MRVAIEFDGEAAFELNGAHRAGPLLHEPSTRQQLGLHCNFLPRTPSHGLLRRQRVGRHGLVRGKQVVGVHVTKAARAFTLAVATMAGATQTSFLSS